MDNWQVEPIYKFDKCVKWYEKKHQDELVAVLANLQKLIDTLNEVDNFEKVTGRYIHRKYKAGIKSLDQSGQKIDGTAKDLQETRLYFAVGAKIIHPMLIGNKDSQADDVKAMVKFLS